MTAAEILTKLQSLGDEKMYKHHKKSGARDNLFGAKMGDIRAIAAKIKTDHQLAIALWETDNIDARFLATLIMKPKELSAGEIDAMVKSEQYPYVADMLYTNAIKDRADKEQLRQQWLQSGNGMAQRLGWSLTAGRITRSPEGIDIPALLNQLEAEMPTAPPEVQWTMNTVLAQIGINHPQYRQRALEIGESLGIYRDYPVSKGCTSPFAPIWINEMVKRQG